MKPCKDSFTYFEFNGLLPIADPDRDTASFCGNDIRSPVDMEHIPSSKFDLHFFSSQCCQNCGKSLQFTCLSQYYFKSKRSGQIHRSQRRFYVSISHISKNIR